jgi:outer membrane protein, multidrug efflux system
MKIRHVLLIPLISMAGCSLTPDYERPDVAIPEQFTHSTEQGESIANLPWWELFQDEKLNGYIKTALLDNNDLGAASARFMQVQAQFSTVRANQYPFVDASFGAGRGKQSQQIFPGTSIQDNFSLLGSVSYEVDLWGKLSRATEGARADLLASEATYNTVVLSVISNVATTYNLLRDLDARLQVSQRTVAGRRDSLKIIQARFDGGTVPEIDVNQAQIELSVAEVAVASFERQIVETENTLRFFLGLNPGTIERGPPLGKNTILPNIQAGIPSELLRRRPDVLSVEQQLHAEVARVGVAEALRYPSISLTGSFGSMSDELSDLNSGDTETWDISGGLLAPIFNSGKLKAQAEVQRAKAEEALHLYEATLQQAFREVEDALVAIRTYRAEYKARHQQTLSARNAARLSRTRYDGGVTDYLEVLDSERSLFSAELEESSSQRLALNAIIQLYKSLGGGWMTPTTPNTATPTP